VNLDVLSFKAERNEMKNHLYKQMAIGLAMAGFVACAESNKTGVMVRETPTPSSMDNPPVDAGAQMTNPDSGVVVMNSMDAGTIPNPMSPGKEEIVQRAYEWLTGKFNSQMQATQNAAFYEVQLYACEVKAPQLGDRVLYVEQAIMSNLSQPYRQRLYAVKLLDDGRVESVVYSLTNANAAVGLCDRAEISEFSVGDYQVRTGCSVFMTWDDSRNRFVGGTNEQDCESTLNGSTYATAEVELYEDRILSLDRGYNANDIQVWGSTAGAYVFDRQDTTTPMPAPMPGAGETCADAMILEAQSQATPGSGTLYTHVLNGKFGVSDDYNPIDSSGKAPGCSLVYDAFGNDVVYKVTMQPGQTLHTRFSVPYQVAGGIYVLDSCNGNPGWPDLDGSGMCGSNEYRSHGYCAFTTCDPVEYNFHWPLSVDGVVTAAKDFYLVVDEVGANTGTDFTLEWWMETP